jgi:hypothetical protein
MRVRLLAMMFLVGCGGDARERTPSEKCDDFVDTICDRAFACVAGVSGTHSDCVAAITSLGVACASVKSVGTRYDSCMDKLDSSSCATLFPVDPDTGDQSLELPQDCAMVLIAGSAVNHDAFRNVMYSRVSEAVGLAH